MTTDRRAWLARVTVGTAALVLVGATVTAVSRVDATSLLAIDATIPDPPPGAGGTEESGQALPPSSAMAPAPLRAPDAQRAGVDPSLAADLPDTTGGVAAPDALVVPDAGDGASGAGIDDLPVPLPVAGTVGGADAQGRFESQFPSQAAASQDVTRPATTRWAVLVGINDHGGSPRSNIGSRQDAEALYTHLIDLGWLPDHVVLLTDRAATKENIVEAINWLARKTDQDSVAVFSYSGHARQWSRSGPGTDDAFWPSDNVFLMDREFTDLMADVDAGRLWINVMACQAEALIEEPGLTRPGRLLTYSSQDTQKSYEDPSVGHSVWGWNLVVTGMQHGHADANGDGTVTVQEAVTFAIPRAEVRTSGQVPYGPQQGGMIDHSGGAFSLVVPVPST